MFINTHKGFFLFMSFRHFLALLYLRHYLLPQTSLNRKHNYGFFDCLFIILLFGHGFDVLFPSKYYQDG